MTSACLTPQRGVALLITLIAMVALLTAGAALIRSFDVSTVQAGNLAFKRDVKNRAERGVLAAQALFAAGQALEKDAATEQDSLIHNYSSKRLATDPNSGVPNVLLSDDEFTKAGFTASDLSDPEGGAASGVTIRYVIDRQCISAGALATSSCAVSTAVYDRATDNRQPKVKGEARPIYRISVRATGPRNTQVFIQQTVVR